MVNKISLTGRSHRKAGPWGSAPLGLSTWTCGLMVCAPGPFIPCLAAIGSNALLSDATPTREANDARIWYRASV